MCVSVSLSFQILPKILSVNTADTYKSHSPSSTSTSTEWLTSRTGYVSEKKLWWVRRSGVSTGRESISTNTGAQEQRFTGSNIIFSRWSVRPDFGYTTEPFFFRLVWELTILSLHVTKSPSMLIFSYIPLFDVLS